MDRIRSNEEFASEQYFSKLRQTNSHNSSDAGANEQQSSASNTNNARPSLLEGPTFTLPSRQRGSQESLSSKSSDKKKRTLGHDASLSRTKRRPSFSGFDSFRSKVHLTNRSPSFVGGFSIGSHSGGSQSQSQSQPEIIVEETIEEESFTFADLLSALPTELQAQIISPLSINTILNLRLVCKSLHEVVCLNEAPITRYHIANTLPAYTMNLYPVPDPANLNLHYLGKIWHRLHVAAKLATMVSMYAQKEIFLRKTEPQKRDFIEQYTRMRQRLTPLVFTFFHFFETYRHLYIQHLSRGGAPLSKTPFTLNPFELKVMEAYDDKTLLYAHQVFPLVMSSFTRRFRPPSYVGRVERSIRGYFKDRPTDETYATILTIGGLRQAQRFWEIEGYNQRRSAVDDWQWFLQNSKVPFIEPYTPSPKSKISRITNLGRKKSSVSPSPSSSPSSSHDPSSPESPCHEFYCVRANCLAGRKPRAPGNLIFNSSLSKGPPMCPPSRDQLAKLIGEVPELRELWVKTAEWLILERRIVSRPSAIKVNSAVLLDLIREDGSTPLDNWVPERGPMEDEAYTSDDLIEYV